MEMKTENGHAILFDSKKARISNLRKTVYNVGMGVSETHPTYVPHFVSLTYREVDGWRSDHIKDFLKRIRVYLHRKGLKLIYVWVAELQKRGALHYHLLIWLPPGVSLPKVGVGKNRRGWWTHGFADQRKIHTGVGYLMKYLSKDESKHSFPKGVRIYGYGGVEPVVKQRVRFYRCSKSIRTEIQNSGLTYVNVDIRRAPGGKVDILSGWFFQSDWKMTYMHGRVWFFKRSPDQEFDSPILLDIAKFGGSI